MRITVPNSLKDITISQYQDFLALDQKQEPVELAVKTISIMTRLTTEQVRQVPYKYLEEMISSLKTAINEDVKFESTFTFNGTKYGFIPKLDDMSIGEYIDIDTYQKDSKNLYKTMSVLYRPVSIEGQNGRYEIEEYTGSINEDFKELPMYYAKGAMVFFCSLGIELFNYILRSLKETKKKDLPMQELVRLVKNGDGTDSFSHYVTATYKTLMQWKESLSTEHSCGKVTRWTYKKLKKCN